MGDWMALNSGRRTFTVIAAGVAIASIAYGAVLHTLFFGEQAVTAIDDIGEAVAAALAAAACAWAASRTSGSNRLGWALMCISASAWAAGEIVWSVYEVGLGVEVPYPSLADAGFLAAVPFAIAGIRAFWSAPRGTSARWRVWFDGVIVALALISTAWAFGLRTVFQADEAWSTKALDLAYPLGDVLIGTILILAVRRATHQQQGRMALLLAGVASYSIADSAFSYLTATGTFGSVGSVLDTGWFAGYLMIALAAIYPEAPLKAAVKQAPLDVWQLALPWMTLLTASAGDVYSALSGNELDLFQSTLTAILAVMLTVNMIFERREFLELLTEIESSHGTLKREFRSALDGIQHLSKLIRDAERVDMQEARRLAADIHREAARLDRLVEGILDEDADEAVATPTDPQLAPQALAGTLAPGSTS